MSVTPDFFHFENSEEFDPEDHPNPKLKQIHKLQCIFSRKFKRVYIPHGNTSTVESLITQKGFQEWKH